MKKTRFPKKVLTILALIAIGLFAYVFLLIKAGGETVKVKEGVPFSPDISLSVSSVYRYDSEDREYLSDRGESWQKTDFQRYIYDLAPEGSKLDSCYYFTYDNIEKKTIAGGRRNCQALLTVSVGPDKSCPSQGEKGCTLYVYAVDDSGRQGEIATVTYHIDWQRPQVGKVFQQEDSYLTEVSDNLEVNYCWLFIDGKNIGAMEIKNGLASFNYPFDEENYTVFARCADHYNPEKEEYLNLTSGQLSEVATLTNQPPRISFCRISPSQGGRETSFNFLVETSDPEGQELFYFWDFGDGSTSSEKNPSHSYQSLGTFEPKVAVSDGQKGEECSTAWLVVAED